MVQVLPPYSFGSPRVKIAGVLRSLKCLKFLVIDMQAAFLINLASGFIWLISHHPIALVALESKVHPKMVAIYLQNRLILKIEGIYLSVVNDSQVLV